MFSLFEIARARISSRLLDREIEKFATTDPAPKVFHLSLISCGGKIRGELKAARFES